VRKGLKVSNEASKTTSILRTPFIIEIAPGDTDHGVPEGGKRGSSIMIARVIMSSLGLKNGTCSQRALE
jgi:hypothetical protein